MIATTTHEENSFKPVKLEILIETKEEFNILNHLFNTEVSKLTDVINAGLNVQSRYDTKKVKAATDPIYFALCES